MSMLLEDVKQTVRQEVEAVFIEISELEAAVHNFRVKGASPSVPIPAVFVARRTSSQAESGHSLKQIRYGFNGTIMKVSNLW
jgi:hypothetical protein